jgi:hypothetical protein
MIITHDGQVHVLILKHLVTLLNPIVLFHLFFSHLFISFSPLPSRPLTSFSPLSRRRLTTLSLFFDYSVTFFSLVPSHTHHPHLTFFPFAFLPHCLLTSHPSHFLSACLELSSLKSSVSSPTFGLLTFLTLFSLRQPNLTFHPYSHLPHRPHTGSLSLSFPCTTLHILISMFPCIPVWTS